MGPPRKKPRNITGPSPGSPGGHPGHLGHRGKNMTEAGVAWQQYDLSDSEADDVDVARSQDRGQIGGTGTTGTMGALHGMEICSMEAMAISGTWEICWFLGDWMLGSDGFLRVCWPTLTPSNSFKHETQGFEISFGSQTEIGLIVGWNYHPHYYRILWDIMEGSSKFSLKSLASFTYIMSILVSVYMIQHLTH